MKLISKAKIRLKLYSKLVLKKYQSIINIKYIFLFKKGFYSFFALLLAACGSKNVQTNELGDASNQVDGDTPTSTPELASPSINNITIQAGNEYKGVTGIKDVFVGNNDGFNADTKIIDLRPYDGDELTITASKDFLERSTVTGIETITFTTAENSFVNDTSYTIDLANIANYNELKFENPHAVVDSLQLIKVNTNIIIGKNFPNVKIDSKPDLPITLSLIGDTNLVTTGASTDLIIQAGGRNIIIESSSTTKSIDIKNAKIAEITAPNLTGDVKVIANGNVKINDINSAKGNINIESVGSIDIVNAEAATGTLTLNNIRAPVGTDIVITNAKSMGGVLIESAGSIIASENGGFAAAQTISASFSEDSTIYADGVANQKISLNAINKDNQSAKVILKANSLESLDIGGTSPIIIQVDGDDISGHTVKNNNTDATLNLSSFSGDLSNTDSSIKLLIGNQDGQNLKIKSGQIITLDAEISQTAQISVPTFSNSSDATNSSNNSITLKATDSDITNIDSSVEINGVNLIDIQTLNIDLNTGVSFTSSGSIVGSDLTKVNITGSGFFDSSTNAITGSQTNRVTLDASASSGKISVNLDATTNGMANVKTGSNSDFIKIDGISEDSGGFIIQSNAGNDTFQITSNGSGSNSKININGGNDTDTLVLDPGVDLGASDLTISSIEKISLKAGGSTQKVAASSIASQKIQVDKDGTGLVTLTVMADQSSMDLSNLSFSNSFDTNSDTMVLDASNSSTGVNISSPSVKSIVTGSNANDVIKGGTLNDVISGGTGDDTIEGGLGADTLTGGAGDDEFDVTTNSSTIAGWDRITDYQAAAADKHNDKIDNITGAIGAATTGTDVKSAISGDSTGKTVTAAVADGIVTLSGANAAEINTLAEWYSVVSVDGVIAKAEGDADAIGTVAFAFLGNTYLVESNDTFDNNTPNVTIVSLIELTGLTGVTKVDTTAADNCILIA